MVPELVPSFQSLGEDRNSFEPAIVIVAMTKFLLKYLGIAIASYALIAVTHNLPLKGGYWVTLGAFALADLFGRMKAKRDSSKGSLPS
jgi:hypothetical protein